MTSIAPFVPPAATYIWGASAVRVCVCLSECPMPMRGEMHSLQTKRGLFSFLFCAQKVAAEEPEEGERFLVLNVLNYDAIIEAGHVIEEFKYRT